MKRLFSILGLLVGLLLLTAVLFYGNIFAVLLIIPHLTDVLLPFGFGGYFSWILVLPIAIYLVFSVRKLISVRKANRDQGLYMLIGFAVFWCLLMGFVTKDQLFDPITGEARYSFSRNFSGDVNVYPSYNKFDPKTGKPISLLSSEIVETMEMKKNGVPNLSPLRVSKNSQFFRPDATPLFYYIELKDGRIEFFVNGGIHLQTGETLSPVNKAIIDKFFDYIKNGKTDLIVGYQEDNSFVSQNQSDIPQNQSWGKGGALREMTEVYKNL